MTFCDCTSEMANILLVDDDGNVLLTLAIALRRRGHIVTMASDGARAVEHLQKTNFQFLISDIRMPGMSGFELARVARSLPHPPRIILTSAYPNIGTPDGLAEVFIQKPVDVSSLDEILLQAPARKKRDTPTMKWNPAYINGH